MSQAALLSYWNFNNNSPAYNAGTMGSFSSTAAAYGEQYSTNKLLSNSANLTVFNSSSIYIDFTNLSASVATPVVNGKIFNSSSQASTGTTSGGFGTFSDSTINRVAGDSTATGSLIIMNPSGTENGHYITLALSSAGYSTLALSYATRLSSGFPGTEAWSYSLDGTSYTSLTSLSLPGNATFAAQSLDLSALSSNALNNQSTFYLRMTVNAPLNGGSFALDNLQLNGLAVPEPATYGMLGSGLAVLAWLRPGQRLIRPNAG